MQLSNLNSNISKIFNDKTVLIIDDEELVIEICEMMLLRLGHRVFKANSGFEALNIFEDHKNQIDLVILDMYMPEMNGQQLVGELRQIDHRVKVLLSSGGLTDLEEKEIINRGFNGFIRKPYSMNSLSEKMVKILN
ncbi:MAG: response regulator [Cyclobacteriaceae bacterium]|jgi:CheY-like chemotaxis protein|nr:response regulator [Cyclobacteriaceae bacterium]MCK5701200.1 response regulator [Cyclobacteriaceae bacterium]